LTSCDCCTLRNGRRVGRAVLNALENIAQLMCGGEREEREGSEGIQIEAVLSAATKFRWPLGSCNLAPLI